MVEAAMIFPLVIAGVMAVIYIVINLYSSLSLQSSLHIALRNECGEIAQTVYRLENSLSYKVEKDWIGLRPILRMEEEREYRIKTIFHERVMRREVGRSYLINEAEMIRIMYFKRKEQ